MQYLRKTKKSTLYLWVALLSLALLCAQGVKLHVHSLGHDHHNHHDQLLVDGHTHVSIAHLSLDDSHVDHHDQVIYESDASPDCMLTKIFNNIPLTALLTLLFVLLLSGIRRHTYMRRRDDDCIKARWPHFTPLLRAPPV